MLRPDKDKPNYSKTVLDTIAALAENVSQVKGRKKHNGWRTAMALTPHYTLQDELEFKMLCNDITEADAQWQRRMKRATQQILDAKRAGK